MILNDREIRALIKSEEFGLDPFENELVQPSSIDLRLDSFARHIIPRAETFDVHQEVDDLCAEFHLNEAGHVLPPHQVLIAQTVEFMRLPANCQGMIAQRSSVTRLGVLVTSSLLNPGYAGKLPLMISNLTDRPIRLYAGLPICQLVLMKLTGRPDMIYPEKPNAKYHGERESLTSRIAADARRWVRPASPRLADPSQAKHFKKEVSTADEPDDQV